MNRYKEKEKKMFYSKFLLLEMHYDEVRFLMKKSLSAFFFCYSEIRYVNTISKLTKTRFDDADNNYLF